MRLPRSLRQVADVIGVPMALQLEAIAKPHHRSSLERGFRVKVPAGQMDESHPLVTTIGRRLAKEMQRIHAGEAIPYAARQARVIKRDINIARDATNGVQEAELCQRYGVSISTVKRALERVTHSDIKQFNP